MANEVNVSASELLTLVGRVSAGEVKLADAWKKVEEMARSAMLSKGGAKSWSPLLKDIRKAVSQNKPYAFINDGNDMAWATAFGIAVTDNRRLVFLDAETAVNSGLKIRDTEDNGNGLHFKDNGASCPKVEKVVSQIDGDEYEWDETAFQKAVVDWKVGGKKSDCKYLFAGHNFMMTAIAVCPPVKGVRFSKGGAVAQLRCDGGKVLVVCEKA